mgnify:CR=1 FL=1
MAERMPVLRLDEPNRAGNKENNDQQFDNYHCIVDPLSLRDSHRDDPGNDQTTKKAGKLK